MGEKQKNKGGHRYDRLINIISLIMVIVAVSVIIMNMSVDDEAKTADAVNSVGLAENKSAQENEAAGISIHDIQNMEATSGEESTGGETADKNAGMSAGKEETGDIKEDANKNTEDENFAEEVIMPSVDVKEYNNVTLGKLSETTYVKEDYFDNTLFLGDSRTVALQANGFIKAENTFAVNGISHISFLTQEFTDSVTGVTGDIFSIVRERKPDRIYVALGVNGVAFIEKSTFISRYEELIDGLMEASPESKIIVQCILPVSETNYTGGNPNLNNQNIDAMNAELLSLAERKGIFYLDIAYLLKDADNGLAAVYDSGDGLHFSFTGYSTVYDGICRHGVD